jgi:K+-sensing histidine kinase KdpD
MVGSDNLHRWSGNMSRSDPVIWRRPPVIWKYGIAVLSVTAAIILARLPRLGLEAAPVPVFLCAVMFSAWFGGVGPGIIATVLAALAFDYYFVLPRYAFSASGADVQP